MGGVSRGAVSGCVHGLGSCRLAARPQMRDGPCAVSLGGYSPGGCWNDLCLGPAVALGHAESPSRFRKEFLVEFKTNKQTMWEGEKECQECGRSASPGPHVPRPRKGMGGHPRAHPRLPPAFLRLPGEGTKKIINEVCLEKQLKPPQILPPKEISKTVRGDPTEFSFLN